MVEPTLVESQLFRNLSFRTRFKVVVNALPLNSGSNHLNGQVIRRDIADIDR